MFVYLFHWEASTPFCVHTVCILLYMKLNVVQFFHFALLNHTFLFLCYLTASIYTDTDTSTISFLFFPSWNGATLWQKYISANTEDFDMFSICREKVDF